MDVEPPTGDDLNRILVSMKQDVLRRAAAEPPARRRPWARRHLGLTLGLVALLGIGGAGGALALVLPSPFQAAPAPTPTSTPSPTPTSGPTPTGTSEPEAPAQAAAPRPALDVDCDALGERIGVASLVADARAVHPGATFFRPVEAAYRQAGVLRCLFTPQGDGYAGASFEIVVSPAADRGREWISGLRESGLADLGSGDASAVVCDESASCRTSVVAGSWWFESTYWPDIGSGHSATPDAVRPALDVLAAELRATDPPTAWVPPTTSWAGTDCADLDVGDDVSRLLTDGAPVELSDPLAWFPETGIWTTQPAVEACQWLSAAELAFPEDGIQGIEMMWAPGAGWAVGTSVVDGTDVEVAGADEAIASCVSGEGSSCSIDLLVDDSWVHVQGGYGITPENQHRLIPVAEALLTAQAAASGRG